MANKRAIALEMGGCPRLVPAIDDAIALTLRQYGGGSTDYGQALADFRKLCLDEIDNRTTVIILGDARNNNGDARTDVLKEI